MADHDTHDHTGVPGVGGSVATDTIWAAAGDLVQATGNDAAAVLSAGASGKVLTAHGAAAALTWETPSAGGSVATDTIWDAAGDLVQGTGADAGARLAIGSAGQHLVVNAGATAAAWVGGMTRLDSATLGSPAASISFSSIPAGYRSLHIVFQGRTDRALNRDNLRMRFNADSGTNYVTMDWRDNAAGASNGNTSCFCGEIAGDSATANYAGIATIDIVNYAGTTFYKTVLAHAYNPDTQRGSNGSQWANTAAITAILLFPQVGSNFKTGTVATLYGLS